MRHGGRYYLRYSIVFAAVSERLLFIIQRFETYVPRRAVCLGFVGRCITFHRPSIIEITFVGSILNVRVRTRAG